MLLLILFGYKRVFGFEAEDEELLQNTLVFNTFILANIVNLWNVRVPRSQTKISEGFFSNKYFDVMFVILLGLQFVVVEYLGGIFHLMPLKWEQWLICAGFGAAVFPWGFLVRKIAVEDRTVERTEAEREERKQQMREFCPEMTPEQMWSIENVLNSIRELEEIERTPTVWFCSVYQ
jgi:Ca2+-transporting ATPase